MGKKKLVCLLLALLLLPVWGQRAAAQDGEEYVPLTLTMSANLSPKNTITGLYHDGLFYITVQDLCELCGAVVEKESEKEVILQHRSGLRQFVISVGSGEMTETLHSATYATEMPSFFYEGKVYLSPVHFLQYIGARVEISDIPDCQMFVLVNYDIYDDIKEVGDTNAGYWFDMEEVYHNTASMEFSLVEAGVVTLISSSSNPFRLMLDADGLAQEEVEDALLTILQNEGQGFAPESISAEETFGYLSSTMSSGSLFLELMDAAYDETRTVLGSFDELMDGMEISGSILSSASAAAQAYSGYLRVGNVADTQQNVLRKSILRYTGETPLEEERYWKIIYAAAEKLDREWQSRFGAWTGAAADSAKTAGYDFVYALMGSGNPVSIAWDGVISALQLVDMDRNERLDKIYHAYNCYMVQAAANQMAARTYSDWYYNNAWHTEPEKQRELLEGILYTFILQLKSTLSTREYFVAGGALSADEAQEANGDIVGLLRRLEGCRITGPGLEEQPDLDQVRSALAAIAEQNAGEAAPSDLVPVTTDELPEAELFEARLWDMAGRDYDSADPEDQTYALAWAMNPYGLDSRPLTEPGDGLFGFQNSEFGMGHHPDPDFDAAFYLESTDSYGFASWDKQAIDWLVETVLNLTPQNVPAVSENTDRSRCRSLDPSVILCRDNQYYTMWAEVGYIAPDVRISQLYTDGSDYYVAYDWIERWSDSSWDNAARQYAVLRPKEVDGQTVWSVIRTSPDPLF